MLVPAVAAHGCQDGINNLLIIFTGLAKLSYFLGIQLHQLAKAFLVPGKEYKKPQDKNQDRGDHGDIHVIPGVREKRPQQAVRIAGIQQ